MPKMKVAIVPKADADFELIERDIPTPGEGQVRIKVTACGVCSSDHFVKDGLMPWITYPRSPGHEVAGVIDEVGPHVTSLKKGQKVGVGWHGGHDFTCMQCRRGDFINCANEKWTGIHYDGGYAEYMIAPWEAVAAMPDGLDPVEAAPLLCAGITTFNALRHAGATSRRSRRGARRRRTRPSGHPVRQQVWLPGGRHQPRQRQRSAGQKARRALLTSTAPRSTPPPNSKNWAAPASFCPPRPAAKPCPRSSTVSVPTAPCW